MSRPSRGPGAVLFRRRQVWVPTVWGTLLLLALAALLLLTFALTIHGFLAVDAPARGADGRGARTLVVEGWLDEPEVMEAIARARSGHYDRVLTTGGPIERWNDVAGLHTYAARAAATLRAHGLANPPVIAVPAPETAYDRTWRSAVTVRDWAAATGTSLGGIDIYTAGVHARRSRMVYRMAFGDRQEIGVVTAEIADEDVRHWWRSSGGAKLVMGETVSWAWTVCCFWPPRAE